MKTKSWNWYKQAVPNDGHYGCGPDTRCPQAEKNGNCDHCGTIDGRWMEAVNEYASTCDGCSKLAMHDGMVMDVKTQLGYCEKCVEKKWFKDALKKGVIKIA